MRLIGLFFSLFCLPVLTACVAVQQAASSVEALRGRGNERVGKTVLDKASPHYRFERHYLHSADERRHYRIDVFIPRTTAPDAGYPVLYMLDGNAAVATLTAQDLATLADKQPTVLVAIGYDVPTRNDVVSRAYDYTPPVLDKNTVPVVRGHVGGGADVFLRFITTQVKPLVRTHVAVDVKRESLWGHSYGGLFTLYVLFTQPQAFAHYIAGDPSFWWHEGAILPYWQRFVKKKATGKHLAILLGTRVRHQAAGGAVAPRVETDAVDRLSVGQDMIDTLRIHGAHTVWKIFPQYGHGEMIRASLEYALFAAGAPSM